MVVKDFGIQLGEVEFKSLSMEDNLSLIANFSEEEIRNRFGSAKGIRALDRMTLISTLSRRVGML